LEVKEKGSLKKKLWIYLIVLFVIGGLWGVAEFFFPKKPEETKPPRLFPYLNPAKILEIRWQRGDEMIQVNKQEGWSIIHPMTMPADTKVMEEFLRTLTALRPDGKFPLAGQELKAFGLKDPHLRIFFLAEGKWTELDLGGKTAVGKARYGKLAAASDLFLLEDFLVKELDRDLFALRDKRVFSLDLKQIQNLAIKTDNKDITFEKDPKGWRIKASPEIKVSNEKVENFLADLLRLQAIGFRESGTEDFRLGLKASRVHMKVTSQGKEAKEETLILGKEEQGRGLWAKSSRHKEAIFLAPTVLKNIPKGPEEWEEKVSVPPVKKGP
jgi:hypothetical protein